MATDNSSSSSDGAAPPRPQRRRVRGFRLYRGSDAEPSRYDHLPIGDLPLPQEEALLEEVFLRLPIKSIARFRCVCKPWLSVLSSPSFIRRHLSNRLSSASPDEYLKLLLSCESSNLASFSLRSVARSAPDERPTYITIPAFSKCKQGYTDLICSCDGLLCFRTTHLQREKSIFLWNPATGESRRLPPLSYKVRFFYNACYGIAFDESIDDYKIVRIMSAERRLRVEVLSLKGKSWRKIQRLADNDTNYYSFKGSGMLVGGALHWAVDFSHGRIKSSAIIVSFVLGSEKFRMLPLHDSFKGEGISLVLSVLRGCLLVLCYEDRNAVNGGLWIMEEYGLQSSWTHLATVTMPKEKDYFRPELLYFSDDVIIIFCDFGFTLYLYNVKDNSSKYQRPWHKACIYMESLVSPHGNYKIVRGDSQYLKTRKRRSYLWRRTRTKRSISCNQNV